jgi:hypothetical protein
LPPGRSLNEAWIAARRFDRFWHRDSRSSVEGNAKLRAQSPIRHGPLAGPARDQIDLTPFTGPYVFQYYAGISANLFTSEKRLWLQSNGADPVPLSAERDSEFGEIATGGQIRFPRGPDKQVTGFIANSEGRELPFLRVRKSSE